MKILECNNNIALNNSDFYHLEVNCDNDEINIQIKKDVACSIFINHVQSKDIKLNITCDENSRSNIVVWNHNEQACKFIDKVVLNRNAQLNLSYAECTSSDVDRTCEVHLLQEASEVVIHTAVLSQTNKNFDIICHHHTGMTKSQMNNFIVLLNEGSCEMEATGKIVKGAKGSKSHQNSRCLTFNQQKKAKVTPVLIIDENDVEASHAMSLGQIDENQLYYLQSRGLNRQEITKLITYGYLLPIAENIEHEELKELCKEEITKKVDALCLM